MGTDSRVGDWVEVLNRAAMSWYSLLRPTPPAAVPAVVPMGDPYVFNNVPAGPLGGGVSTNTLLVVGLLAVGLYLVASR